MNINYINTGSSPNSGDGDSIRAAFTKVNSNFAEVINTITNLIVSPGSIGPTGPTGPAGSSSLTGVINTGEFFSVPYYQFENSVLYPSPLKIFPNITDYNTTGSNTSLLELGDNIHKSPVIRLRRTNLITDPFLFNSSKESFFEISEHHESQDVSNFLFYRTRGTFENQLPLKANDDVGEISFSSLSKNNDPVVLAGLAVSVDSTNTTYESAKLKIFLNDGNFPLPLTALELNALGTLKINKISELTTGSNINIVNNLVPNSDLLINFGTTNKRWDQAFINTLNISSSIKFPDGTEQTTAGGSGGSFAPSRTISDLTTPTIANDEAVNVTMSGFPGFIIYKISTSHAAWVRIYINDAARTADSTRTESEDPRPDAGVITEVLTTQSETILLTPAVYGFTDPASNDLSVSIVNKSSSSTSITVSMVLVQTEA